ncbi:DNA polymerase V subunit UmuC [Oceanisphaera profunda]|uniref:DNA polymerase V subunit UmuC n=1 Tax=Oceanisphaera profunda TaxID=1416627 RepID=A0A1Y0D7I5_9GAMM|nr:translesion error-prone DNA polymerase V subunit UmuC [Oceanisphaera profunda]ART83177.1 DNA polymerase V subunit UmuC [Oceanisphaera profunda]
MKPVFALVDCNNFYASCERLFRPDLHGRPIVVLSNNDGCVVARSAEAKLLGIKMGVPYFKIKDEYQAMGGVVFSSNYALYADISSRVMQVLEMLSPKVEVYSIDEAFIDVSGIQSLTPLSVFGAELQSTVARWVGINVGVGIAPTKTLAKLANYAAKRWPATGGVVDLTNPVRQKKLLQLVPVEEVWGIGRRLAKQLNAMGIHTAWQLAQANSKVIRRQFSVVVERTVCELNGESCLGLDEGLGPKQQLISSRSFGEKITELAPLCQAVSQYACRAAEKLRLQHSYCRLVQVFVRTSPFAPNQPYYSNSALTVLNVPSNDSRELVQAAQQCLTQIWRPGYRYQKAGVMLTDFWPAGTYQASLFDEVSPKPRSKQLMAAMDKINRSGKGRIFLAAEGIQTDWKMKREYLSPAYTTRISDLPKVT